MESVKTIRDQLKASADLARILAQRHVAPVSQAAGLIVETLERGGRVLLCGNGGSAADAQHLAAELVGRFRRDRQALPALALTADGATLTALSNDYGYEECFVRQVAALGRRGDCLLAFSTSGSSPNVLRAAETAARLGLRRIALTGEGGGRLGRLCDVVIAVPSRDTARIQEAHMILGHILCDIVEHAFAEPRRPEVLPASARPS